MGNESATAEVTCTEYVIDYHINMEPTAQTAQDIIQHVGSGSENKEEAIKFVDGRIEIENDIKETLMSCAPDLMRQYSLSVNLERIIYGFGGIGVIIIVLILLLGGQLSDGIIALLITIGSILAFCVCFFHFYFVRKQAIITKQWRDSAVESLINNLDDWKERYSNKYDYTFSVLYPIKVLLTEQGSTRERIIGISAFIRISKGNEVKHSDKEPIKATTSVQQHKLIITNQDQQQTLTYDETNELR